MESALAFGSLEKVHHPSHNAYGLATFSYLVLEVYLVTNVASLGRDQVHLRSHGPLVEKELGQFDPRLLWMWVDWKSRREEKSERTVQVILAWQVPVT